MTTINLKNFLENKYFRIIVILFVTLFLFFAVINLFSSLKFSELRINELTQFEYIPTLNGSCIYETQEIVTWVKKTTIDTFKIVLNPEIGLFDFKCLGKVSGSSAVQNLVISQNIKNLDIGIVPYPNEFHMTNYASPLKIFEYAAGNAAILSSDIKSNLELNDTQLGITYFKAGDYIDFREKITKLILDDDFRNSLIENSKKNINNYSLKNRIEVLINFCVRSSIG